MDLLNWLKTFNSKERFFLIGQALGNQSFELDQKFRDELSQKIKISVPKRAFVAMDYHLDWIYAALFKSCKPDVDEPIANDGSILGQQEDVDLLVAFEQAGNFHIVMVEAKGVTNWTNEQIESKAKRLTKIFAHDGNKWPNVIPYLVLMSPRPPEKLKQNGWPNWFLVDGTIAFMELSLPKEIKLKRVTRCNWVEGEGYTQWKVAKR